MMGRRGEDDGLIETVADECIAHRIRLLGRAVTALYDEALRPHGVTIGQMSLLVTVAKAGSATPGTVAGMLHMEKSTLSRNVDRMRARGWLEGVATADGRSTELRVTARGRRLLREIHPAWSRAQERARQLLGEEAVQRIARAATPLSRARRTRG